MLGIDAVSDVSDSGTQVEGDGPRLALVTDAGKRGASQADARGDQARPT